MSRKLSADRPKPYPYQAKGIRKIQHFDGRALLADDMGLGKTPQALWWIKKYIGKPTTIVICPKTIKENWRREAKKYTKRNGRILEKKAPPKDFIAKKNGLYIINYNILGDPTKRNGTWIQKLKKLRPDVIIIDEVQKIKNPKSQQSKAVRELCRGVPYIIALGGTGGLENCPAELFPILNILRPDVFPSFFPFATRYCAPRRTHWGWQYRGATNLDELNQKLSTTCMIRRRKADVLHDLPPKTKSVIYLDIDNRKEYETAEKDFLLWLEKYARHKTDKAMKAERLVRMGYLKRLVGQLKLTHLQEWINEFHESAPGEKLLFFGIHKKVLCPLNTLYKNSVLINGSITGRRRQDAIDRFNYDKDCDTCFGNINAAGEGWSCISSSTVAFGELEWKPTAHTQAEDRIHGVGRGVEGKKAMIYYLIAKDTIEEDLCGILQRKQGILDTTLDGGVQSGGFDVFSSVEKLLRRRKR